MPFDLTSASAVFHNLVNNVPEDMLNFLFFYFFDDLPIRSHSDTETVSPRPSSMLRLKNVNVMHPLSRVLVLL